MNVKTILAALLASASLAASAATYEEIRSMSTADFEQFSAKLSGKEAVRLCNKMHSHIQASDKVEKASKNLIDEQKKAISHLKVALANREDAVKLRDEMSKNDAKFIISLMVKCNDMSVASGKPKLYDIEKMKRELGIVSSATNSPSISPVK